MTRFTIGFALFALCPLALAASSFADTQEECAAKLDKLGAAGILTEWKVRGATLNVVVDEETWKQMDFSVKSALAEAFDCAVLGPGTVLPEIVFLSNMTNNVLGTSRNGKLTVGAD